MFYSTPLEAVFRSDDIPSNFLFFQLTFNSLAKYENTQSAMKNKSQVLFIELTFTETNVTKSSLLFVLAHQINFYFKVLYIPGYNKEIRRKSMSILKLCLDRELEPFHAKFSLNNNTLNIYFSGYLETFCYKN